MYAGWKKKGSSGRGKEKKQKEQLTSAVHEFIAAGGGVAESRAVSGALG